MMFDNKIIKQAKVIDILDPLGMQRVKVRLVDDSTVRMEELVWCSPLLPKHLHVMPRLNEYVHVFTNEPGVFNKDDGKRFYIGPIITNLNRLDNCEGEQALSAFAESVVGPENNPERHPKVAGVFPSRNESTANEDFAFIGRDNADIQFKNNELWIRAGYYTIRNDSAKGGEPRYKIFNDSPTFLKLKNYYYNSKSPLPSYTRKGNEKPVNYRTSATLVADEINLISSASTKKTFEVSDRKDLITSGTMTKILQTAYHVPFAEVLIEFLELVKNAISEHTHATANEAPISVPAKAIGLMNAFKMEDMYSDNIRIN